MSKNQAIKRYPVEEEFISLLEHATVDEHGIYTLNDGSIGVVYTSTLPSADMMSEGELIELAGKLENQLKNIEGNTCLQVLFNSSNNIKKELKVFHDRKNDEKTPPIVEQAFLLRKKYMEVCEELGFFTEGGNTVYPNSAKILFSIRYFPTNIRVGGIKGFFVNKREYIRKKYRENEIENKDVLKQIMSTTEMFFKDLGTTVDQADADELIWVLFKMLHPELSLSVEPPKFNPDIDIREQAVSHAPIWKPEYLVLEPILDTNNEVVSGTFTTVMSIKEPPGDTQIGMLMRSTGKKSIVDILKNFTLCFNIFIDDYSKTKKQIKKLNRQAENNIAGRRKDGKEPEKRDEITKFETEELLRSMEFDAQKLISMRAHIIVQGSSLKELKQRIQAVGNALSERGFETIIDMELGGSLFLNCLPLNFHPFSEGEIQRHFDIRTNNASHLLPMYGRWTGTETPHMMLFNRWGQPSYFSRWDTDSAAHSLLFARTGQGKSVLTQYEILCALRRGSKIVIIDKGGSYKVQCDMCGAQYIEISKDNPICNNMFTGLLSNSKKSILQDMLSELACDGKSKYELPPEMESVISMAVMRAFAGLQEVVVFNSDEDIENLINQEADRKMFVGNKRKKCVVKYTIEDAPEELRDESKDEIIPYEMEVCELVKIKKDVWNELNSKKKDYLKKHFEETRGFSITEEDDAYFIEYEDHVDFGVLENALRRDRFTKVDGEMVVYVEGKKEIELIKRVHGTEILSISEEGRCLLQKEVYFSDFAKELLSFDPEKDGEEIVKFGKELSLKLKNYYGDGYRAPMFDGPNAIQIEHNLTLIEAENLNLKDTGDVVYYLTIMNQVYEHYKDPSMSSMEKYLYLEEGHNSMREKRAAKFYETLSREARRFKIALAIITQSPEEMLDTPEGRAIFTNTPVKMFMKLPSNVIDRVGELMNLSNKEKYQLTTVETRKGLFAEVMICCDRGKGVFRHYSDPMMLWMSSSDGDDKKTRKLAIDDYKQNKGMSKFQASTRAVIDCAVEYPGGMSRGKSKTDKDIAITEALREVAMVSE